VDTKHALQRSRVHLLKAQQTAGAQLKDAGDLIGGHLDAHGVVDRLCKAREQAGVSGSAKP